MIEFVLGKELNRLGKAELYLSGGFIATFWYRREKKTLCDLCPLPLPSPPLYSRPTTLHPAALGSHCDAERRRSFFSLRPKMSVVLPGELIDTPHKKLSVGPGLFHLPNTSDAGSIISTRAGVLNHSPNGRQWWIESNSRRVRGCQALPVEGSLMTPQ